MLLKRFHGLELHMQEHFKKIIQIELSAAAILKPEEWIGQLNDQESNLLPQKFTQIKNNTR